MAIRLAPAAASALADRLMALVDAGAGAGTLKVYTGTLPSDLAVGTSTLLATFTLTDPAAAAAVSGVATLDFDPDISATVAADGTAGWFLVEDSAAVDVFGGTCGTSGADLNFSSVTWVTGGLVNLATGTVTMPQAA
jgi:hypothetical protein